MLISLSLYTLAAASNLVVNGDFEKGASAWYNPTRESMEIRSVNDYQLPRDSKVHGKVVDLNS